MMVQIFTDISRTGPKIRFNTGNVVNNLEEYNPILPAVEGQLDNDWTLTVWRTPTPYYLNPAKPSLNDTRYTDPVLGTPKYTWGDGNPYAASQTRFSVYGRPQDYTYELSVANGDLHDIHLQTFNAKDQGKIYTLDHPITFTVNERISVYDPSGGYGSGYQAGNNFNFNFNISESPYYKPALPTYNMVVQIPIYWTNYPMGNGLSENGTSSKNGGYYTPFSLHYDFDKRQPVDDTSAPTLRLADRSEGLHKVSINLNAAFERAALALASRDPSRASAYLDPQNWTVGQYYAGIEASGTGRAVLSLDVSHPNYQIDTASTYDYSKTAPIQTIDDGHYLNTIDSASFSTLSNTVNIISLIGSNQSFSSRGSDTVFTSQQRLGTSRIFNNKGNLTVFGDGNVNIYAGTDKADILNITAGSGTQTLFAAQNILTAYGNHDVEGRQAIIAGENNTTSIVYGGRTHQIIYTGNSNFTIVAGNNDNDSNGTQDVNIEGGVSSYWGGVENATFALSGGSLYAFLGNGTNTITADMTKKFVATFANFSNTRDYLALQGGSFSVTYNNGNTDIVSAAGSHITLQGTAAFSHDNGNGIVSVY